MNERIRELYRQAHSVRHYDGDPALDGNPPTVYWQGEVSAQRFAELIVRECIEQAHSVGDLRGANDDMIYGADTAALRISKHFGVEK